MDIAIDLLIVLALVALNGFFVAAEFALVKVRTSQLAEGVEQGEPRAILTADIKRQLDGYLSATQVGITLASLALGWVGEPVTEKMFNPLFSMLGLSETAAYSFSFGFGFFLLTVLHITLGELLPKSIAISQELKTSLAVSRTLHFFYRAFSPLIWVLNSLVNVLLRMLGLPSVSEEDIHTREELKSVFMESARHGVVERGESNIIESLFEFRETTVREIMVHRSGVAAINLDAEPREIISIIENEGFSRLPVYRRSVDEISGVLHVKDLLPHIAQLERLSAPSQNAAKEFSAFLERAVRPALFVSETQSLTRLMYEFKKARMHMGIVVSEHGGVEGVVTLEDILEELVGEMKDESDGTSEEREVIEIGNTLYVNPTMSVDDFNEKYKARFPELEESAEYQTISGYVQKHSGRIPNIGDMVDTNGLRFTITRKVRNRLQQIKIEHLDPEPAAESRDENETGERA